VVQPRRLELPAGGSADVRLRVRVSGRPRAQAALGTLSVSPVDGASLRIPWSVVLESGDEELIGPLALSRASFRPSELAPSVLTVRVGGVRRGADGRTAVEPAARLDAQLGAASGTFFGLVARIRDVLPGSYAFGLTGHDPKGRRLAPGPYVLRLVAWPVGGGRPSIRSVRFRIE
jgi:hypothetical protein